MMLKIFKYIMENFLIIYVIISYSIAVARISYQSDKTIILLLI